MDELSDAERELLASIPLPYSPEPTTPDAAPGAAVENPTEGVPGFNWPVEIAQPRDDDMQIDWLWSIAKVDRSSRIVLSDAVEQSVLTRDWWVHHFLGKTAVILSPEEELAVGDIFESYSTVARNSTNKLDERGRVTLSANELNILEARPGGRVLVATQVAEIVDGPLVLHRRVTLFSTNLLFATTLGKGLLTWVP